MPSREENKKRQDELMEKLADVKTELTQLPGVIDVGIGIKEVNNELTGEVVYRVYVKEKKQDILLTPEETIPSEIKGVRTDVLIVPEGVPRGKGRGGNGDRKEYRPLQAGIQVGNGSNEVGTLGGFAHLNGTNLIVMLSNHHVLAKDINKHGLIGQPDFDQYCCCCCAYHEKEVALLVKGIRNELVDCAIAKLLPGNQADLAIGITNSLDAEVLIIKGIDFAVAGETVFKIGAVSGFTKGVIKEISGPVQKSEMIKQIYIKPHPSETYHEEDSGKLAFSDRGDSGSLVLNNQGKIVGLLWGGTGDFDDTDKDTTFACHIHEVLLAFEKAGFPITIENTPEAGSNNIATDSAAAPSIRDAGIKEITIREQFMGSEQGQLWLSLFERHRKEILHLVEHDRQVMVAWQRFKGPSFMAHIAKSAGDATYSIPVTVENVSLQQLMLKMSSALKASGSDALKTDIDKHGLTIIDILSGIDSLTTLFNRLNEPSFA